MGCRGVTWGRIWGFLRPGTGTSSFWCKKRGWFMGWMAVMWWKLEPPRVRGRRKVLCFQRLAYGAEEQEGEWTAKRIPAQHTSFLSDESCVEKKKKKEQHSCFFLGINPWKEYANQHSPTILKALFFQLIDWVAHYMDPFLLSFLQCFTF